VIDSIELAGEGALMALLEKRKKALAAEGLFDQARKKEIPQFVNSIGVVTSPTGAVIQDILHRIEERFPLLVKLWPVLVQGQQAAAQIAAAIEGFNVMPAHLRPDVLIVARGGGSLEDLWPFNEEIVVRAAANSQIPLISAVGHETDTTLIDYAADRRAPTPSAAAEMATPVKAELLAFIEQASIRMRRTIVRLLKEKYEHLMALARGLPHPSRILDDKIQKLDHLCVRLQQALPTLFVIKEKQLDICSAKLKAPTHLVDTGSIRLQNVSARLDTSFNTTIERHHRNLDTLAKLLESYHYKRTLERGFACVKHGNVVVTRANDIRQGDDLQIEFADGITNVKAV